jgi:hypothetical protein
MKVIEGTLIVRHIRGDFVWDHDVRQQFVPSVTEKDAWCSVLKELMPYPRVV